MKQRKIYYMFLAALLLTFLYFSYQITAGTKPLRVIFLDVGQGDSILIQKGIKQILIDGGPSGKRELSEIGKYIPFFDREIELVIATHPDKDHIAGLIDVARNYKIDQVLLTGAEKDTDVFKEWKDVLSFNKVNELEAWRGTEIKFDGIDMKIISPPGRVDSDAGDANNSSIVTRLDWGENSFLFTGDIESGAENEILESLSAGEAGGSSIDVDILKVAHHGSKHSSSEAFLDAASPEEAVISVGANNSYGHPTNEVLEALRKRNIRTLRTDEKGDIIYKCKNENEKCEVAD
ncbi:MAG: ComEC/Rec2 family competence protein [Parcubacteria group bacterium]|jgi:competence protein ComEC